ncbi:aminoglycoside phosphotransferase family protein [Amycolatopsis sp. CA-230715]|uniref:aminoglycoside phosphotransferase family protein n=1 Tax=Amycolatopsis sp. CA-230715 TaxID=2745196 RepID=UPI001C019B6C|nr:aminoglycoside phosphotransferase family protein [Amycolatopsis sp. CA-230715]QWF85804.1 hypothetical protein HUW46_09284 [Amycolatopsis sp. CA-230715]
MTRVPGAALSADSVLREDPHLPDRWWEDLARALEHLSAHPPPVAGTVNTERYLINNVRGFFDVDLDGRLPDLVWTTAHADLHWGNLTGPELAILDWGDLAAAPAEYDLATLYCNSLLVPAVAVRVLRMGADVLTEPGGRVSLLLAACRYLTLAQEDGPYRGLGEALTALGRTQLAHLSM